MQNGLRKALGLLLLLPFFTRAGVWWHIILLQALNKRLGGGVSALYRSFDFFL